MELCVITDNTTIVSIESIFENKRKDPWAFENAGYFADSYIWSDCLNYILPVPSKSHEPYIPRLIRELTAYDSNLISSKKYYCQEIPVLKKEYLENTFRAFLQFIHVNLDKFSMWLGMHHEDKILREHNSWIGRRYFYDLHYLKEIPLFKETLGMYNLSEEELLYAFDVSIRYPFYGEFVGKGEYYLTHQIRKGFQFPELKRSTAQPPLIPISFKKVIMQMITHMDFHDYITFLHEARYLMREKEKMSQSMPSVIDKKYLNKIARKLKLPPKLNSYGKTTAGVAAGIVSMLGTFPFLGPLATVAGMAGGICAVMSPIIWDKPLPRTFSEISWLDWAYDWDIETAKK